jgi:hypothetical protein
MLQECDSNTTHTISKTNTIENLSITQIVHNVLTQTQQNTILIVSSNIVEERESTLLAVVKKKLQWKTNNVCTSADVFWLGPLW